ncbi:cyclin-domain-containing protein [Talaromyces proteolyticus]|uniref:Cyclin-domain-containing protein n=1 Tax=Talaromyces proteolyticus TaxID=1131652 RepID=A0AAD4PZS6_9EURO|nr:cyclin-domain-containing protein [Talaromyces proteolyticus]KAH8703323.1 cyclin-domain-containing protein [Talaromyces proteolyticus]
MLGGVVNRVTNPDSSLRSASAQHNYSLGSSDSSRTTSTPISSTITPSLSAHTHTPSYSSPHDVPAYVQPHPNQINTDHSSPFSSTSSDAMTSSHRMPSSQTADANSPYRPSDLQQGNVPMGHSAGFHIPSPSSPRLQPTISSTKSLGSSVATSPSRIKVRDLSHIQSFASEEFLAQSQRARQPGRETTDVPRQYEISSMPVTDIIEMVAGLLTKITATNDLQHEHIHRHIPPLEGTTNLSAQASSVLAFHGKNVPSITILSYLTRIHKYCPTTYEVFLSLLVYFDRMTEMVNRRPIQRRRNRIDSASAMSLDARSRSRSGTAQHSHITVVTPPSSSGIAAQEPKSPESSITSSLQLDDDDEDHFANFFIVDSFNIHRLVIAGVTCASKFFSDVFYTNSRYAKVGGLPLVELNHLELQFLLLNDFRLSITVEELDAYGTMLVEFYAREVVAQQQQQAALAAASISQPISMEHASRDQRHYHGHHREGSEYGPMRTPP